MNAVENFIFNEIMGFIKLRHIDYNKQLPSIINDLTLHEYCNYFKYNFYKIYNHYNIDALHKEFKKVFNFDRHQSNNYIRKFLSNEEWKNYE